MPDVFITLEEAAAFESVSYKTLTQRIYRNPQQYKTKSQAREGGGKDQVLISTSSLSAKARKAWRAAQKVEGSEVIIDKRAQEAVPWYVTADLNQYTEANKKRFYEAVELAARVQDAVDKGVFLPNETSFACAECPYRERCKSWHSTLVYSPNTKRLNQDGRSSECRVKPTSDSYSAR